MTISERLPDLDQIGFLLGRAYYSGIGLLQRWLDNEGLSDRLKPGMGGLLFALFRKDDRNITALAAEWQVAKSTMTGMVARMREAGLVTVEDDANDGRAWRLKLTPRAWPLKPRCLRMADEMEALLGQKLTAAGREQFRRALALVARTIAEQLEVPEARPSPARRRAVSPTRRRTKRPSVPEESRHSQLPGDS